MTRWKMSRGQELLEHLATGALWSLILIAVALVCGIYAELFVRLFPG